MSQIYYRMGQAAALLRDPILPAPARQRRFIDHKATSSGQLPVPASEID